MSDKARQTEFPPLELECKACLGSMLDQSADHTAGAVYCNVCQGTGKTVTKFGKAVLALVERQMRIDVNFESRQ